MTGNNKVWRASLAGLASVAMLATMGVVAGTANAAAAAKDVTVTFKGAATVSTVLGYKGESLADLASDFGVAPANVDANFKNNDSGSDDFGKYFGGWTVDGTNPVDWTAPVTADTTVKPLWLTNGYTGDDATTKSDLALLDFSNADLSAQVKLPTGTDKFYVKKDAAVPASLLPVDRVNGELVTDYTYTTNVPAAGEQTVAAADLAKVTESNATISQLEVVFGAPKTKGAYKVTVDGSSKSQYGYVKGAKSDVKGPSGAFGTDFTLGVDVAANTEFTVPDWFTVPQKNEPNQTVTSWTDATHGNAVVGNKLTVASDTTLEPTKDAVTKGFKTTFLADKGGAVWQTTDATKNDKGSYFVTVPEGNPTKDGFKFAGWRTDDTSAPAALRGKTITAQSDGVWEDFANNAISSNLTFYPVFTNRDTKLVVTFRDANYNGSQKDVKVEVKVPGTLEESQAPKWTRAGYTLDHWFKDANGNGIQDSNEKDYNFTGWLTDKDADYTLTADWERANADKARAALDYIVPSDTATLDFYRKATGKEFTGTKNDGTDFTKASFDAYKTAYKAALTKYGTDVYNNPNTTVTEEASAEIINDLNAALQKLQFAHKGGADYEAFGKYQAVHRLHNGQLNRHFYSNDALEILKLTSTQFTNSGWEDDGVMFYGAPAGTATDAEGNSYAAASNKAAVDAGIKPIVVKYVRFFNPTTGDHVYTVEGGEEATALSANAEWNLEGLAYYVPAFTGTQEVSRFYNGDTNRHLFSSSASEQAGLVQNGWKLEGNGFAFKGV